MTATLHALANATFDDWWPMFPSELRTGKALCRTKWNAITGDGLDTKTKDKDSGLFVDLFLKDTPEAIIAGTKRWVDALPRAADYGYLDIQYQRRAPQFLNQGGWMDD